MCSEKAKFQEKPESADPEFGQQLLNENCRKRYCKTEYGRKSHCETRRNSVRS
jgi:hypothetical protein